MKEIRARGVRPEELDRLGEVITETDQSREYRNARRITDVARDQARAERTNVQMDAIQRTAEQRRWALRGAVATVATALALSLVTSERFQDSADSAVAGASDIAGSVADAVVAPIDATLGRAIDQMTTLSQSEMDSREALYSSPKEMGGVEPTITIVIQQP